MQMNHAGDGRRHANWTDRGASGADLHTEEGRRRSGVAKPERWPVPIGWEKNESRITLKVANQEPPAKGLTGLTSQLRAAHCMFSIQSGAIGEVWGAGPSASKLGGAIFFFVIGINSLAASDWLVMSRGAVPIALKSGMHPGPIFDVLFFLFANQKERERERERHVFVLIIIMRWWWHPTTNQPQTNCHTEFIILRAPALLGTLSKHVVCGVLSCHIMQNNVLNMTCGLLYIVSNNVYLNFRKVIFFNFF